MMSSLLSSMTSSAPTVAPHEPEQISLAGPQYHSSQQQPSTEPELKEEANLQHEQAKEVQPLQKPNPKPERTPQPAPPSNKPDTGGYFNPTTDFKFNMAQRAQQDNWWALEHPAARQWERERPQPSNEEWMDQIKRNRMEGHMLKMVNKLKGTSGGKPISWEQVVAGLVADGVFKEGSEWANREMYIWAPKILGDGKSGTQLPDVKPSSPDEVPRFGEKTEWMKGFLAKRTSSTEAAGLDNSAHVTIDYNMDYEVIEKLQREFGGPAVHVTAPSDGDSAEEKDTEERTAPVVTGTSGIGPHDYAVDYEVIEELRKKLQRASDEQNIEVLAQSPEKELQAKKTPPTVVVTDLGSEDLALEEMKDLEL